MPNFIDMSVTEDDVKIILEALRGNLVRQNDMNFQYLSKVTSIGLYIEGRLKEEGAI